MFCYNCGERLIDGSKFCSSCGTKLPVKESDDQKQKFSETHAATNKRVEAAGNIISDDSITVEDIVTECFRKHFKIPRQFGQKVYIIGRDPINVKMKENIISYYLQDELETPLLLFDYQNNAERGFLITDRNFVFYYDTKGQQSFDITGIYNVTTGKAVLANIMKLVTFDGIQSSEIYLTGIEHHEKFVLTFSKFIEDLNTVLYGSDDEENEFSKEEEINFDKEIDRACIHSGISSIYCEIGSPIFPAHSKKYVDAKNNFGIDDKDRVFLIFDATILGGCRKGFAICSSGIYYCENRQGYIPWSEFSKMPISHGITGLKIGSLTFNVGSDGRKLLMILDGIKESIS